MNMFDVDPRFPGWRIDYNDNYAQPFILETKRDGVWARISQHDSESAARIAMVEAVGSLHKTI